MSAASRESSRLWKEDNAAGARVWSPTDATAVRPDKRKGGEAHEATRTSFFPLPRLRCSVAPPLLSLQRHCLVQAGTFSLSSLSLSDAAPCQRLAEQRAPDAHKSAAAPTSRVWPPPSPSPSFSSPLLPPPPFSPQVARQGERSRALTAGAGKKRRRSGAEGLLPVEVKRPGRRSATHGPAAAKTGMLQTDILAFGANVQTRCPWTRVLLMVAGLQGLGGVGFGCV